MRSPGTYHKLVNTTPNPRATKKSKDEFVGPLPPPLPFPGAEVAALAAELVVVADMPTHSQSNSVCELVCSGSGFSPVVASLTG